MKIGIGGVGAMNMTQTIEHLDRVVLFNDFTEEEKAEVSSFTENFVLYREGCLIVQQNTSDPSLYILLDGEVVIKKEEQPTIVISSLLPGSVFGTLPTLPIVKRNNNAKAKINSTVLRLDRPTIRKLSATVISKFNTEFIKILFRRIGEMSVTAERERGEMMRISSSYEKIKDAIDNTPSHTQETRIISNFMYAQLKNIHHSIK